MNCEAFNWQEIGTSMSNIETIIRIRYGTAPHEPTANQLNGIAKDLEAINWQVDDEGLRNIVYAHCLTAGKYKYAGEDHSDLISLIAQATKDGNLGL